MDLLQPSLEDWLLDLVQESWLVHKVSQGRGFDVEAFATKVVLDKVDQGFEGDVDV